MVVSNGFHFSSPENPIKIKPIRQASYPSGGSIIEVAILEEACVLGINEKPVAIKWGKLREVEESEGLVSCFMKVPLSCSLCIANVFLFLSLLLNH